MKMTRNAMGIDAKLRTTSHRAIAVTDLDGTLLDGSHRLSRANRAALHTLGEAQILRVVATGRSPFSARKVIDSEFPIDYLVCSSGAAILSWPQNDLLKSTDLPGSRAIQVAHRLKELELDFMLHAATPENHRFLVSPCESKQSRF